MAANSSDQIRRSTDDSNDDNTTDRHQGHERPDVFSTQFRIQNLERVRREALILQSQTLCAADRRRTDAVLERMGLSTQKDPVLSPQPPAGPKPRTLPSALQRLRRVSCKLLCSADVVIDKTPPQTPITPSPPPAAPRPRRRLPVMRMYHGGEEKDVAGGYRLQTAKGKLEEIQERVDNIQRDHIVHPQPLAEQQRSSAVTPVAPAPPPGRAPPQKRVRPPGPPPPKNRGTRCGVSVRPVNGGRRTDSPDMTDETDELQIPANMKLEQLQCLYNPGESLSLCFKQLISDDWEKRVAGLKTVRALVQNHLDTLMPKLHEVVLAVIAEIKNLRTSVATAAIDTLVYMYVYLRRHMNNHVERTGRTLLQRVAQANANVFLQQRANVALEALVLNCDTGRVMRTLVDPGLNHKFAAVRTSAAQMLHLMADRLGADAILRAGRAFNKCFLTAVCKMSLDASSNVRPHGHAILQELSHHRLFINQWKEIITQTDRAPLERILRTAKRH